jgi:hypothetical protein
VELPDGSLGFGSVWDGSAADFRAAAVKLRKYYAREGFESLRGSDLMILDLERRCQADY